MTGGKLFNRRKQHRARRDDAWTGRGVRVGEGSSKARLANADVSAEPVTRQKFQCSLQGELLQMMGGSLPSHDHDAADLLNSEISDTTMGGLTYPNPDTLKQGGVIREAANRHGRTPV